MATGEEKNGRRMTVTAEETTIERRYLVGTSQHNAIPFLGWTIGDSYPGNSDYRLVEMRTVPVALQTRVIATYSNRAIEVEEVGTDPVWRYSGGSETTHTRKDLDDVQIGHRAEGVEVLEAVATADCTIWLETPAFTVWYALINRLNAANFQNCGPRTFQYLGFDAAKVRKAPGHDYWECIHHFKIKAYYPAPYEAHNGFELRWKHEVETTVVEGGITFVTLEFPGEYQWNRLYDTGDFTLLQIPGEP